MSLEDRRKRLAKLKAETACRDCGRKRHWSGDAQCNHKKKKYQTHANVIIEVESETKQEVIYPYRLKEAYEKGRKVCKDPDCECEEKDKETESEEEKDKGEEK